MCIILLVLQHNFPKMREVKSWLLSSRNEVSSPTLPLFKRKNKLCFTNSRHILYTAGSSRGVHSSLKSLFLCVCISTDWLFQSVNIKFTKLQLYWQFLFVVLPFMTARRKRIMRVRVTKNMQYHPLFRLD